ncbi:MAG: T9SS type A sorting domain-containing protein [bacterium]
MKSVGITFLLLITPFILWSYSNNSTGPSIAAYYDVRYTTFGQWQIPMANWGAIGGCSSPYLGFWPRNSGHNYIYGAGVWTGGVIPNSDTLVSVSYAPSIGGTEFAPGPAYSDPNDPQWRVYFSVDYDYPLPRISFEDGYTISNDFDTLYHMPDTLHVPEPLGITITHKTSVWPKGWAQDVVFIQTTVKNDTTYAINDFYYGFCLDFDIGNETVGSANDRCGIDLQRKLFYGWQEEIEPGSPPWRPGMLGYKLLSPCSLAAAKRFTLNNEPSWDWQRYMLMAGYNWISGAYEPYDTIWPAPDDQRIIMTTGPMNPLAPGDSIVIDWALIASDDTLPPSDDLNEKADKAQAFYNIGPHSVHLTHPSSNVILSGLYRIGYTAQSITGAPLLADIYLFSEYGLDTVALDIEYYGAYDWFTDSFPDCVLGRLYVMVFDSICFGAGMSDDYFTIDNSGNAVPYFRLIAPLSNETIFGDYDITWFARDPEFQDSLFVSIFFKSQYDSAYHIVASNEPNDSIYTWNTQPYRNGSGSLIVEVHDDSFTLADTVPVYLLNEISGGSMEHIYGLNNCVNLDLLIHEPGQITGHTYELRFLEHHLLQPGYYYPEYLYEMTDSNTGIAVLDTYSLKDSYNLGTGCLGVNDFSPIIDGFSIHAYTDDDNIIARWNFHCDSVKVILGMYPEDSIETSSSLVYCWWAYRGSRIQLDWHTHANGGLTLLATDLDYEDTIPYKPYNHLNSDSAAGWCFDSSLVGKPSDTLRDNDIYIFLCGGIIEFKSTIPPPNPGDCWLVFPSSYSPPIKGNLYRFTPSRSVGENAFQVQPICFNVYPVPFVKNLTITYSIPQKQKVKIAIYDVVGRQVKLFEDGIIGPGQYTLMWNGIDDKNRKVSSGVYFCRFVTGEHEEYHETKKFIMIKSNR